MPCSDQFLTYLKAYGYSPIRLPKADLRPLEVLALQGKDLDRLGSLTTVLVTGANIPAPPLSLDTPAANINGQRTSALSLGVGLSILGSIIGAMGGSVLGLDAKYKQAKTIVFEFQDVLQDAIEVAKLDQYLTDADLNPFSRHVAQMLEADELLVVTATIKSSKLTVEAKRSDGATVELGIPEIQGVVGGNVSVGGQGDVSSTVTYQGSAPLVFGFQAVRLFYDRGEYRAFKPLRPGDTAMRALEQVPDDGADHFVSDGPFAQLGDGDAI